MGRTVQCRPSPAATVQNDRLHDVCSRWRRCLLVLQSRGGLLWCMSCLLLAACQAGRPPLPHPAILLRALRCHSPRFQSEHLVAALRPGRLRGQHLDDGAADGPDVGRPPVPVLPDDLRRHPVGGAPQAARDVGVCGRGTAAGQGVRRQLSWARCGGQMRWLCMLQIQPCREMIRWLFIAGGG